MADESYSYPMVEKMVERGDPDKRAKIAAAFGGGDASKGVTSEAIKRRLAAAARMRSESSED